MKKKVFLYLSSGLALVLLSASTPSNNPASSETTSQIEDWLIVGSPTSVFTPGQGSLSVGRNAFATAPASLALGNGIDYGGGFIGGNTTAAGAASIAIGNYARTTGFASLAMGQYTTAGYNSIATGYRASATGSGSVVLGSVSSATGSGSKNLATDSITTGNYSFASGINLEVHGFYTHVVGRSNDFGSSSSSDNPRLTHSDNHLFVIGNGETSRDRSNALVTKHSGETSLINREWDESSPLTDSVDDGHGNTGEALIVAGHTRLKGKVIIEQAQGDISMGIFGQ